MANQSPKKTFRIGLCSASVFKHTFEPKESKGPKRTIRNVNVQRRYQDEKGEWQTSTSFGLADLPAIIRVLQLAQGFVESIEADTTI